MNVYVETNFILELVFAQEESDRCNAILKLCEARNVRLVVPAFCFAESYQTLISHEDRRRRKEIAFRDELKQLERFKAYKDKTEAIRASIVELLLHSEEEEDRRLTAVFERVSMIGTLIPLEPDIISSARSYRVTYKLEPKDSIIYASVQRHLALSGETKSCFIARDKHFDDPDIDEELANQGCKKLPNFTKACQYLERCCGSDSDT